MPTTKKTSSKSAKSAAPKAPAKPALTGLAAYFDEALFLPELKSKNKAEAFEEMVDALCATLGKQHKQTLLSMLHHREMLGTTGIGRGVAIPHGRTLLTRHLRVVFGRSKAGIDYGARDNEPVNLIFLVVAPFQDRGNVYLPTLGKLVELVRAKPNRDKLMEIETFDQFVEALSAPTA